MREMKETKETKETREIREKFDIAIIGAGPGGYVAAIRAGQLKQKVLLIEKKHVGGVCLNWGCIPSKALLKAGDLIRGFKEAEEFGIKSSEIKINFKQVIARSRKVVSNLTGGVRSLLKKNKVTLVEGTATLTSPGNIEVDGKNYQAENIVLATGARARTFPGIPVDGKGVLYAEHAMVLDKCPSTIGIIGAGAIGVEFADFFQAFGAKVTLIEAQENLLPLEDQEISKALAKSFQSRGIDILLSTKVEKVESKGLNKQLISLVDLAQKKTTLEVEKVLVAVGVAGNIENLGLEDLGIETERGFVKKDPCYQTNIPNIFAIGDVAGAPLLAHVASHEGIGVIENIVHKTKNPIVVEPFPSCTYCSPQVASTGKSEEALKKEGVEYKKGVFQFRASGKAIAVGHTDGFVKILFSPETGEIFGAHIFGADATELIGEMVLAIRLEATPKEIFDTIHAHPTLSESVMEAAMSFHDGPIHS